MGVNNHENSSGFLGKWPATSLSVHYGRSVVPVVLILSQEGSEQLVSSVVTGDNHMSL